MKLRYFTGASTEDMEDNTKLSLKQEPDYPIIHVRANNAANMTFCDI